MGLKLFLAASASFLGLSAVTAVAQPAPARQTAVELSEVVVTGSQVRQPPAYAGGQLSLIHI